MQAYLELVAGGQVAVEPLIDRVIEIEEAPVVYDQLAKADGVLPLGVLIHYPDEPAVEAEPTRVTVAWASRIRRRTDQLRAGRRRRVRHGDARAPDAEARRSLLSARRRQPHRHRRAATSRETIRSRCSPAISTRSCADPEFQLVVIATRHDEHADQVVRSLSGRQARLCREAAGDLVGRSRSGGRAPVPRRTSAPLLMVGLQPAILARAPEAADAGGRTAGAARDSVPAQRRLSPARSLGARRAGRRAQRRRSVPHVRRLPVPRRRRRCGRLTRRRSIPARCRTRATTTSPRRWPIEDGTLASLVYTALGPKSGLGKEHITVFCDGEAFIVDDFKKLTKSERWLGAVAQRGARQGPLRGAEPVRRRDRARADRRRFRSTKSSRPPPCRSMSKTCFTDDRVDRVPVRLAPARRDGCLFQRGAGRRRPSVTSCLSTSARSTSGGDPRREIERREESGRSGDRADQRIAGPCAAARSPDAVLKRGLRLWLYWPNEQAVECVDRRAPAEPATSPARASSALERAGRPIHRVRWRAGSGCGRDSGGFTAAPFRFAATTCSPSSSDTAWMRGRCLFPRLTACPPRRPTIDAGLYLRTDFWAPITSGGSYGHTCYVARELAARHRSVRLPSGAALQPARSTSASVRS